MGTGILLLGHGSMAEEANLELYEIANMIKKDKCDIVEPAFLQFRKPNIFDGVKSLAEQNVNKIFFVPYFLYKGIHVQKDLPEAIQQAKENFPHIKMIFTKHIGPDPKMADLICERVEESEKNKKEFFIT